MARYVFDASAMLALLLREPGGLIVADRADSACVSAVNLSEVVAKLIDRGASAKMIDQKIAALELDVREFNEAQAVHAGHLRKSTRVKGLSLGDRACLALAASLDCPALTTDKAWASLDIGIKIELIR